MFKLKKKTNKIILIGVFVFNFIILLSFIFDLLIRFSILSSSLTIFALPIEILSRNFTLVILLLLFEGLLVGFCWFNFKKDMKMRNDSEEVKIEFDFLLDDTKENITNTQDTHKNSDPERLNINSNDILIEDSINYEIDATHVNHSFDSIQSEITILLDEEEYDISPGFLAKDDTLLEIDINKKHPQNKTKDSITDYQFALYQNIVNNNWLYEKVSDRERIGFDNNAINESNISLSDLNSLVISNLIHKKEISHPTGSFFVFTSNPNIEREIIFAIIRRMCLSNRFKIVKRKIDFPNWKEFGLAKKTWQFDIEIPQQAILIVIWTENAFLFNKAKLSLKQEYKDELKALFAAITLKFKIEGKAVIITNNRERLEAINKYIKSAGWGKAYLLDISSNKFESNFINLIK
ncbi:MAG: hypothetical protein FK730_11725 [Asgard group archaeon]|nr:hypothetical protein [Asgard group archaeon]